MNQFDLNSLFERFDKALGIGRELHDPKRLRANQFMLVSINESGICTFEHRNTGLKVKFDQKQKRLI